MNAADAMTLQAASTLPAMPGKGKATLAQVKQTAQDFEANFLGQMFSYMFQGLEGDAVTGDPESDEVYRSWMTDEYGRIVAKAGGIGIASHIEKELLKLQEAKP